MTTMKPGPRAKKSPDSRLRGTSVQPRLATRTPGRKRFRDVEPEPTQGRLGKRRLSRGGGR